MVSLSAMNLGSGFMQWKQQEVRDDNGNVGDPSGQPSSHTLEMVWTTAFDPNKGEDETFEFELGKALSFPSKWKFILRPIHLKSSTFVAVFANLDEIDNKKYDDVVQGDEKQDVHASSSSQEKCLEIPVSWSIQLLSPENQDVQVKIVSANLDFGQGPCFGVNRLVDVSYLHLFRFPNENEKLKLKFEFTLFKSWTKIEPLTVMKEEQALTCSNVTVITPDGQSLDVNRIALFRSPYFSNLLLKAESEKESTGKLVMNVDKPMEIMRFIICHINFGQCLDELQDPNKFTLSFVKDLAKTAAEYGLKDFETYLLKFYPGLEEVLMEEAQCTAMNKKMKFTIFNR